MCSRAERDGPPPQPAPLEMRRPVGLPAAALSGAPTCPRMLMRCLPERLDLDVDQQRNRRPVGALPGDRQRRWMRPLARSRTPHTGKGVKRPRRTLRRRALMPCSCSDRATAAPRLVECGQWHRRWRVAQPVGKGRHGRRHGNWRSCGGCPVSGTEPVGQEAVNRWTGHGGGPGESLLWRLPQALCGPAEHLWGGADRPGRVASLDMAEGGRELGQVTVISTSSPYQRPSV